MVEFLTLVPPGRSYWPVLTIWRSMWPDLVTLVRQSEMFWEEWT